MPRLLKISFASIPLLGLLFLALFPLKSLEWGAATYCRSFLGAHLEVEGLQWKEGALRAENISFLQGDALQFTAERVAFFPKKWRGALHLESAVLFLGDRRGHTSASLPCDLSIDEGQLLFDDGETFHFSLSHVRGQGGSATFDIGSSVEIRYTALGTSKRTLFEAECGQCDLAKLSRLAHHIWNIPNRDPALDWICHRGAVAGALCLKAGPRGLEEIEGSLSLKEVEAENPSLTLRGAIGALSSHVHLDLTRPNPFETCCALLEVDDALLSVDEVHPDLWEDLWDLQINRTRVQVAEGKVEHSQIDARLLGMQGELALDWGAPDALIGLHFSGSSREMKPLLPSSLQSRFAEAFPNDAFFLEAHVKRKSGGLELEGNLTIRDENQTLYPIAFGCHFGESEERLPLVPTADSFVGTLKEQFHLSHRRLGWFRAAGLPLTKFLSPFLLHGVHLAVSGKGDVEGTFDDNYLVLFYQCKDFLFEGQSFSLASKTIDTSRDGDVVAVHYVNLGTGDHVGFLPLKKAVYTQNNIGWTFTEGSGIVQFESNKIYLKEMSASWQNLLFEGELDVAIHSLDDVDLWIRVNRSSGPLADARAFLCHISPSTFWDLPLEGKVASHSGDVRLHYRFHPRSELLEGKVRGQLEAGCPGTLASLEHYAVSFDYDALKNRLHLSGGKGTLVCRSERYDLFSPSVTLSEFPQAQVSLELDVSQKGRTLFSLAGKTHGDKLKRTFDFGGETCSFRGVQEGSLIAIEALNFGNISATATLDWQKESCHINSLSLHKQNSFEARFSGAFDRVEKTLVGEIFSISLELSSLKGDSQNPWLPSGRLSGGGEVRWDPIVGATLGGRVHVEDLCINGLEFGANTHLSYRYSTERGWSVEGLALEGPEGQSYDLGMLNYHPDSHRLVFEEVAFALAQDELAHIFKTVNQLFPDKLASELTEMALELKGGKPLEGSLRAEVAPTEQCVEMKLKKGSYWLFGKKLALDAITLSYGPNELSCQGICTYLENPYWCCLNADPTHFSKGTLTLSDREGCEEAIVASWERDQDLGWCVRTIEGECAGLQVHLDGGDFSDEVKLAGSLSIDASLASKLLPNSYQRIINKLKMGYGYTLQGEFLTHKQSLSDVVFNGKLLGEEFLFGGVHLNALEAKLTLSPKHVEILGLSINDWAGSVFVEKATLAKEESVWSVSIPSVQLCNLRPSFLRGAWVKPHGKGFKSLLFPSCYLTDLQGSLGKRTSFSGGGAVQFTHIPKKNFLSNLLYIPTEITARIGLDLSLLVPVRGTIGYNIHDGRIYLTQFKEMYSEGKRSRFYLAGGNPAYIDFDGNLNMKVKMKQYNLLMKLAEFFTVTVRGTVFKPTYTLMNQFDDNEETDEE